jgi:hypothetical protein
MYAADAALVNNLRTNGVILPCVCEASEFAVGGKLFY